MTCSLTLRGKTAGKHWSHNAEKFAISDYFSKTASAKYGYAFLTGTGNIKKGIKSYPASITRCMMIRSTGCRTEEIVS